jgi:hypothetical protein
MLTEELKRPISQGTVSRWLNEVRDWLEAGNVLPDLPQSRGPKPVPIDPTQIDVGKRRDGRAKHQRKQKMSDSD